MAINDIDKEIENNSDMDNKSVMLRTESNKSQETSLAVQNHGKSSKTAILDFYKPKVFCILIVIIMLLSNIFRLRKV